MLLDYLLEFSCFYLRIRVYSKIKVRQCKYLNNVVEQDHRLIKRITKPMLGFKNFYCAKRTLACIELIRMIKKCQMRDQAGASKIPAELFYGLAL